MLTMNVFNFNAINFVILMTVAPLKFCTVSIRTVYYWSTVCIYCKSAELWRPSVILAIRFVVEGIPQCCAICLLLADLATQKTNIL